MTGVAELERGYRRWLRLYPKAFRREHEAEILGVLLAGARAGQRRPDAMECLDLTSSALRMHLRATVPRSELNAIRLMYAGGMLELAAAVVTLVTIGDVRSAIVARNPGYTAAQWHAEVAGSLEPVIVGGAAAAGLCLWMAWATGRGHRWAKMLFVLFVALNVFSLFRGLSQGSAIYAQSDLAVGVALCLVQLAAVALIARSELRQLAARRAGVNGTGGG
jgi:hypothetical protein